MVEVVDHIFGLPNLDDLRGHPDKVLAAIDDFSANKKMLMHIGPDKGGKIASVITERKPDTMIELGGYVGYSAIMFGDAVRRAGGRKYLSLELSPHYAALANRLVELAGLQDVVEIIVGPSHMSLARLVHDKVIDHIDMMFIDHWQSRYLPDLHLVEQLGLLKPDVSVFIADNVLFPGAPDYVDWVRASPAGKREKLEKSHPNHDRRNDDLVKIVKEKGDKASDVVDLENVHGNPNYVYTSEVHLYELFNGSQVITPSADWACIPLLFHQRLTTIHFNRMVLKSQRWPESRRIDTGYQWV